MVNYFAEKPADPRIVERLESYMPSAEPRALDLGCGGGRHSEMLARMAMLSRLLTTIQK
jgi:2-polyprenyl-3-methyl-5-hydroxy-6-metoxy-1,4-benzoquinol methylase